MSTRECCTYGNMICRRLHAVSSSDDPAVRDQSPSTETETIRPVDQDLNTHTHAHTHTHTQTQI